MRGSYRIRMPDGGVAFICGVQVKPCSVPGCGKPSSKECDYPVTRPRTKGRQLALGGTDTCDAKLCAACAVNVGPNRDYCPPHAKLAQAKGAL